MFTIFHNYKLLGEKRVDREELDTVQTALSRSLAAGTAHRLMRRESGGLSSAGPCFLSEGGSKAVVPEVRQGGVGDVRREEKVRTGYPGERESNQGRAHTAGAPDLESDERSPGSAS